MQYNGRMASFIALWGLIGLLFWGSAGAASPVAPKIQSLLKPEVFSRVVNDREIMTHADLDGQHYSFYAAMLVRASERQTRSVLTNYALYSKMISYIDRTVYDPKTQVLDLSGAIFGYRLHSWVRFEQVGDHWIRFRIIRGHFTGMTGEILFESGRDFSSKPENALDTLVYMGGSLTAPHWPPAFIVERGAEIVFGLTARRMRSYIAKGN